ASGWLVVTMPFLANTSERVCANHPLARSPRVAENTTAGAAPAAVGESAGLATVLAAKIAATTIALDSKRPKVTAA
ncbi:hypothetical protein, partial [Enterococcus faecium]